MVNLGTAFDNFSDNLMSRNEGKLWFRQLAVHYMKISPANSAGQNPHEHLSGPGEGVTTSLREAGPQVFQESSRA